MAVKPAAVVVADDDPLICSLLEYKLGQRGFSVLTAADGEQALDLVRGNAPDLVVLDSMMPVLDGAAVLRKIREDHSPAELPVIMLTARREETDIISALQLGANDYITKPFILKEIVLRIENLIDRNGQGKPDRTARGQKVESSPAPGDDNLTAVSGVGPKTEKLLHSLGIFRFEQIAAWSADDIALIEAPLAFKRRVAREDWISQAKILASA
jgi:DNA-binding response OmpR family regulator